MINASCAVFVRTSRCVKNKLIGWSTRCINYRIALPSVGVTLVHVASVIQTRLLLVSYATATVHFILNMNICVCFFNQEVGI